MRIRINYLLQTLALSAGACSLPQTCMGEEHGVIQYAASPRWGEVQTASGVREAGTATVPSATSLFMANSAATQLPATQLPATQLPATQLPATQLPVTQPPATRALPAQGGPTQVPAVEELSNPNNAAATGSNAGSTASGSALTPLQNRELSIPVQVVDLSVAGLGTGALPESASAKREKLPFQVRAAAFKCVHWHPSDICHFPLRFEEPMLERHGHVRFGCLQSFASGAKFFATIPMVPYLNTLQPSHQPVHALGNYRPGSGAPLLRETIPYDRQAAVVEALSLAGFFWAVPL